MRVLTPSHHPRLCMQVSLGQLGFWRYRAPLLAHLRQEVGEGQMGERAKRSLAEYWEPLVGEVDGEWYRAETLESGPQDREEGCLFAEGGPLARKRRHSTLWQVKTPLVCRGTARQLQTHPFMGLGPNSL